MQHSRPTLAFKPLTFLPPTSFLLPLHRPTLSCFWPFFLYPLLPLPFDSLRVLQRNDRGLRARSTELLHFISSHPVDLICIQESNLNSSSSFWIPRFSALWSDCPHSRSGILSPNNPHASGGVNIFVWQSLSFSELSTSSLSSFNPYSDYVGVSILPNNSSSLSFLNVYTPPIYSSSRDRTDSLSPSSRNLFILEKFNCHHPLWDSKYTSEPCGKYSIGSSPLISHFLMTLTHVLCSTAPLSTSILFPPLLLLGGALGLGVRSPTNFSNCPSLSLVFCPNKSPRFLQL